MQNIQPLKYLSVLVLLLLLSSALFADEDETLNEDKPFAKAHIILQLSDADPKKQALVLDIANNLIRHYGGADMADIEIIAFASGIDLLFEGGSNESRIASLAASGIKFYICMNTVDTRERKTGKRPKISKSATGVQTGVAFLVDEIQRGYTHIRP
ncbi:MAG: hypothetical protein L3J24_06780 [Xanthomonadales bacterium]|nr:hypothetical protein [Xanthomonadales bacterium]